VVQASADDTVVTRVYDLATAAPFPSDITDRVLRNEFTATLQGREDEVVVRRAELQAQLTAADEAGDQRLMHMQAGISAGLVHAIEPAGEIVRRIVAEAERILRERPNSLLR
jgi:nitronate monooxygenase